jgi:predicted transcriptional regulator
MATIRVRDETNERLRALAEREQRPVSAILDAAVVRYEDVVFWADVLADAQATDAALGPRAVLRDGTPAWSATLADGLIGQVAAGERALRADTGVPGAVPAADLSRGA